jgi:hypothetical protein
MTRVFPESGGNSGKRWLMPPVVGLRLCLHWLFFVEANQWHERIHFLKEGLA